MTIDERVRDALHAYADPIEPAPGSWDRIESRLDDRLPGERRPRTPLVFAAIGIFLIVALIAVAVVRDSNDNSNVVVDKSSPTSGPAAAARPPQRVLVFGTTASGGGSMVILPSASRGGVGDMGSADGIRAGAPVAVTPDGAFAYVVRKSVGSTCGGGDSIFEQAIGSGARAGDEIPNATAPAVSPDGRDLAYGDCDTSGEFDTVVLRDLRTNTTSGTLTNRAWHVRRLQFSPDSKRLLMSTGGGGSGSGTAEFEVGDGYLQRGDFTPIAPTLAGYWRNDALLFVDRSHRPATVIALPRSNGAGETLLDGRGIDGSITDVVPNLAGDAMLVVVDHSRLYWWAPGMAKPVKLDDAVLGAAWMPDPASGSSTPAGLPLGIAAVRDNELVVLGASDGARHSSLGPVAAGTTIAPSADGRIWILGSSAPPLECDRSGAAVTAPTLQQLDTPSESRHDWVGGAYAPVANRDDVVAYGYACDGNGLGLSSIRTEKNYRVDPMPQSSRSAGVRAVRPLGWSPDGRTLLYFVDVGSGRRLFAARFSPAFYAGARSRDVDVTEIREPALRTATMSGDDTVIGVLTSAPTVLVEYRIGGRLGAPTRLTDLPEPVTSIVADPSGSHFLIVTSAGELWRWSRGQTGPAPVADRVSAAAWLPWS
jgi:hypothetical protein